MVDLAKWQNKQETEKERKIEMAQSNITMKREKWDTRIQFHRKKRVMLRHLKRREN